MELIVMTEIKNALLQTRIPELLGGSGNIFYRSTIRDTPLHYLNFSINLQKVPGEVDYLRLGEIIFDIWNYDTTSTVPLYIERELKKALNRAHIIAEGIEATRVWYEHGYEASVENNRSNRRSEDEFLFKREVAFGIRGYDLTAHMTEGYDVPQMNAWGIAVNPPMRPQQLVDASPQPNGSATQFGLPEPASQVFYYLLDGYKYSNMRWEPGNDFIDLDEVPGAGTRLKIAYVPQ